MITIVWTCQVLAGGVGGGGGERRKGKFACKTDLMRNVAQEHQNLHVDTVPNGKFKTM